MKLPLLRTVKKKDLMGKRVLLRLGLNAAMSNGKVVGGFRIKKVIPTVNFLKKNGARVIIVGHIGRDPKESLRPVADYLNERTRVGFVPNLRNKELPRIVENMKNGTAIMLENLRSESGETENDIAFAKYLASFGDMYVNDAFSASHRSHASIVLLPKLLPAYVGFQFEEEVKHLSMALKPTHPFLFILGGGKAETKVPLMKKFINLADHVFMGGVPAHAFFKENNIEIGKSLADAHVFGLKKYKNNKKILLPVDVIVKNKRGVFEKRIEDIDKNDVIEDAGQATIEILQALAKKARLIVWNGPLGDYEHGFDKGTADLLKIIAHVKAKTIIGGGDTLTVAFQRRLHNKFTFISTGGGAMLDFLADGELPGITAVKKSGKKKS